MCSEQPLRPANTRLGVVSRSFKERAKENKYNLRAETLRVCRMQQLQREIVTTSVSGENLKCRTGIQNH